MTYTSRSSFSTRRPPATRVLRPSDLRPSGPVLIWSVHSYVVSWDGTACAARGQRRALHHLRAHVSRDSAPQPHVATSGHMFPKTTRRRCRRPSSSCAPGVYVGSAALFTPAQWNTHIHHVPTGKRTSRVPPHQSSS